MCKSCGSSRVNKSYPLQKQPISSENSTVTIMLNPVEKGQVRIIGPVTKHDYGLKAGGDIFEVYLEDQRGQPEKFILVSLKTNQPRKSTEFSVRK